MRQAVHVTAVMEGLAMLAAAALWAMGFKKRQLG
jgi:hypothetical protein